ncbi:lipopolysaccharide kinase InaA family protein [Flavobacteriaceae bacterium MHTCC 0001]
MKERKFFNSNYLEYSETINSFVSHFDTSGKLVSDQERNSLKSFRLNDEEINVKSFKIPNIVNQITYRFFRKSKAQRSFEYANVLLEKAIGTPTPIAYYEFTSPFLFKRSFYVSKQQNYDLTYRELTTDLSYPEHEKILRAFTRFTFAMHENSILFLDHSPGNTLIEKDGDHYKFYLVDLNRMRFGNMDFETRIKNFERLTVHKSMVEIMSDEYAKCLGADKKAVFSLMWKYTENFQEKYHKRMRVKKKLKFWKRL